MEQWHYHTVIRDGVNLSTRYRGPDDAPTVLCVHGYPDNGEVWDALADALGDSYRVVTYDVRGAGASSEAMASASSNSSSRSSRDADIAGLPLRVCFDAYVLVWWDGGCCVLCSYRWSDF